jgi:hypothetical protein
VAGLPPEGRIGVVRDLRIHGWGGDSDVVYVPWTGSTYEVAASAAEVLRHLLRLPQSEGSSLADLATAFDGLLAAPELTRIVEELAMLHLIWRRDPAAPAVAG